MALNEKNLDFLKENYSNYDAIIVGAGYAGAISARELAQRLDMKVALFESRSHIAGNAYDTYDKNGVLVHVYGPHIFHSTSKRVYDYLSRFTEWRNYEHKVLADIHNDYIPVPFNKNSIEKSFDSKKAERLIEKLIKTFGDEEKVPIIELRKSTDEELQELAEHVYQNVFLYYTQKQWGLKPEEIDPGVTARVPVLISRDNRYFQDPYQGMPLDGYTKMFERILDHPNIDLFLDTDAKKVLEFKSEEDTPKGSIFCFDHEYKGIVIFSGQIDELFDYCFGALPYRTLDFTFENHGVKHILPCGTVNYTVSEDYTRISEFSWMTGQEIDSTTIMKEYSKAYEINCGQIPYYAIISEENNAHYNKYLNLANQFNNLHLIGRLAEYRYYNMDVIVLRALELVDNMEKNFKVKKI